MLNLGVFIVTKTLSSLTSLRLILTSTSCFNAVEEDGAMVLQLHKIEVTARVKNILFMFIYFLLFVAKCIKMLHLDWLVKVRLYI